MNDGPVRVPAGEPLPTLRPEWIGVLFVVIGILLLVSFFCMTGAFMIERWGMMVVCALLSAADSLAFHTIYDVAGFASGTWPLKTRVADFFLRAPSFLRGLVLLLLILATVAEAAAVAHATRGSLSIFSAGEAMNLLPVGVLFSAPDGMVLYANEVIEKINNAMENRVVLNANDFWRNIGGMVSQGANGSDLRKEPILCSEEEHIYSMRRRRVDTKGGPVYEVIATNITEEQKLKELLDRQLTRVRKMNRRLLRYQEEVDDTVKKEELNSARQHLHDQMGTTLLTAKAFILGQETSADAAVIQRQWLNDMILIRGRRAAEDSTSGMIKRLKDAGTYLGIDLQLMGELPRDAEAAKLICTGIQECMTNAAQHARATQIYVSVARSDEQYEIHYSNNGEELSKPIREGGGLSILRSEAAKLDAVIEYLPKRHFHMVMRIPRLPDGGAVEMITKSDPDRHGAAEAPENRGGLEISSLRRHGDEWNGIS